MNKSSLGHVERRGLNSTDYNTKSAFFTIGVGYDLPVLFSFLFTYSNAYKE